VNRLYNLKKRIIGLTGGIATGKSSFSDLIKKNDISLICADSLVREIYERQEAIDFIKDISIELIDKNEINFKKLRKLFFSTPEIKTNIENFIYSRLEESFLLKAKRLPSPIIYDVPLLFEKKLQNQLDKTVLIYATEQQQIERLCKRDQIDKEFAKTILKNQLPIDEKKELADLVIDNTQGFDQLNIQFNKYFLPFLKKISL